MSKEKKRLPKLNESDELMLDIDEFNEIHTQLGRWRDGAPCSWCGNTRWGLHNSIFTRTVFSIEKNVHVHNKTVPVVIAECINCGKQDSFNLERFGLTSKNAIQVDQ